MSRVRNRIRNMPQAKTKMDEPPNGISLFDSLPEEKRHRLLQSALRQHFKAHELIFSEGDACRGWYLIEKGTANVFGSSISGREQILASQGPGGTLGELAVLDGGNYPTSAIAATEADLLLIRKEDLQVIFVTYPEIRIKFLELVASRVRPMIDIVKQLSFSTVRQRLAALLLRLALQDGKTISDHDVKLTLGLSYREVARQIGTVPELVSRSVGALQASGLIHIRNKTITIFDPKSLKAEAES